jgi:negative regulator of sigma E activity
MKEHTQEAGQSPFEARSRELFHESVEGMDMRVRSRLTQARHAALEAAAAAKRRPWLLRIGTWTPAAGVTAAALLGAVLWFGFPAGNHGLTAADSQPSLEDLDIVASSDEGAGDAIEMLQNDLDFYDFSDKAANSGPAA